MRVLVTGGAGFIGSHLVEALLRRGDQVTVLDNLDDAYDPSLKEANLAGLLSAGGGSVRLVRGDLRDPSALHDAMAGVDAVAHLAARAGVRPSLRDPQLYASVNVGGTAALLDALRLRPGVPLVFASSSSVYGASATPPFREDDAADRPLSPYAATKRACELLGYAAHAGWGTQVCCLRFFTVYGPRQRPDMAISRFLSCALDGRPLPVFGDLASSRDYTWVGDTVAAILAALDHPPPFAIINVGGGRPVTLGQLVQAVGVAVGAPVQVDALPPQAGDVPLTLASVERAEALLGWRAKLTLEEGLARTADWLRAARGAPGSGRS